jgi:hypothetical protein
MNSHSLLSTSLLLGALLVGCGESPRVEEPPGHPPPSTPTEPTPTSSSLRVPIPAGLRESGGVVVVSRLHASRPAQESVTEVAAGTQEFEIQGTEGEVLAVSVLGRTGAVSDAAMVRAEAPA